MESSLSQFFGRPTTVSRPHLFAEILLFRLKTLANVGSVINARLRIQNGQLNVMTGGGPAFMVQMLNKRPYYILGAKTRAYVEKENRILQEIQRTSELILLSAFQNHNLRWQLHEFEQRFQGNPDVHIETSPEVQKALQDAYPRIAYQIEAILRESDLDVGPPASKTAFHLEQTYLDSFDEDPNGKRHLRPEHQKLLIENLSQGKEMMLSYFHIKPYEKRIDGRPGFLSLPEKGPYLSRQDINAYNATVRDPGLGRGGPHNVTVVDVIRDPAGRIEYVVVRNSWGLRDTSDHGYYYISVDYLAEYGASYIADISVIRKPE